MPFVELIFAAVVAGVVVAVGAVAQATAARRAAGVRRLDPDAPARPVVAGRRGRLDGWFETAVERAELDASAAGVAAVMLLLAAALGGGALLWRGAVGLAALGVLLAVLVPLAVVALRAGRYRQKMQDQLPDAYRSLAGAARAGLSVEQAVEFYAERGPAPLAGAFAAAAGRMRLGEPPAAALRGVSDRVGLLDFELLASTVGLYAQTGGNLPTLLDRLADGVRDRNRHRGLFAAATAQARVVAIAIGATGPLVLLAYILTEPSYVQTFLNSPGGWLTLAGCFALEAVGVVWLWWLLRVDY